MLIGDGSACFTFFQIGQFWLHHWHFKTKVLLFKDLLCFFFPPLDTRLGEEM